MKYESKNYSEKNGSKRYIFFFFWNKAWSIYWNGIINTETTGLIYRKPRMASKNQVYLLLSSSPPSWTRSWNFFITLLLQCLAFLHNQQEVVGREPPGGPVPLRGLVMPLPLAVIPHFFPLASDCSAQPRLGPFPLSFPAADWWGPPNGGWSIFNTCANHRFHQSLSVSRQPKSALHLVWLLGHDHLNLNDHWSLIMIT